MSYEVRYEMCNVNHVLDPVHWQALAAAGWTIDWHNRMPSHRLRQEVEGPRVASKWFDGSAREVREQAISEWELITGMRADAWATCDCCPDPHLFTLIEHEAAQAA